MISVDGLAVEFGGTTLFSDISFVINEKDRIALMGKNGAGKSTLLKILAGVRQPTRGKVSAPKDCVVAYLPQHLMTEDGRTVFDETAQAFAHLHEMEAQIDRLNKELETRTDYESDSYMALIEEVSALSDRCHQLRGRCGKVAARPRVHPRGFPTADERFQRRLADAHRAGKAAVAKTGRAPARRADEPPRHRIYPMARRFSDQQRQSGDCHQPRPQVCGQHHHPHY